jgi:hypothetical protein
MSKPISAEAVKTMLNYYYLVAYCPPQNVKQLAVMSKEMRSALAKQAGLKMKAFTAASAAEAAFRVVAYHQATREPEKETVEALAGKMESADGSPGGASAYQSLMAEVAGHPGRAKPSNRLHRQKGCALCAAPCRYGFFTLISDPVFSNLLAMLNAENQKPAETRDPVNVLWTFTTTHLWATLGVKEGFVRADHLGNLSFCLLLLATARSRFPVPEKQLTAFQGLNQRVIENWKPAQIDVRGPAPP